MTIGTKRKVEAEAQSSTSTHFPNNTTKPADDNGQQALNHQVPETLTDPEDDEGGSTHFNNNEEYNKKSKMNNGGRTTAAAKPGKTKPVPLSKVSPKKHPAQARLDADDAADEVDLDTVKGPDADANFKAGGPDSGTLKANKVKADNDPNVPGQQATTNLPNAVDPAAGYLTVGSDADTDTEDSDDTEEADEVDADFDNEEVELKDGDNPQSLLEVDDNWDAGDAEEVNSEFDDEDDTDTDTEDSDELEVAPVADKADNVALLDVDGTDDEGDDVVFATVGTRVHAIKANRIVASLGKKVAVKAGHGDMYLSDQFQEVTEVEMQKHGLRAGLKKMGFVLATVNVGSQEVLNKRVEAKAAKLTAAVRRSNQVSNDALNQCLAIAAVGINKQYFKDTRNELRAALEEELQAAGVRGGVSLVRRVFASYGVDYAKSILTVANKLSGLPEVQRNAFASALDMTSDEAGTSTDDEEDLFGDSASPDFQSEFAAGDSDDEFNDEFAEEQAPNTVQAALLRGPIHRRINEVKASSTGYSVNAAAVLSGKAPLPFA